MKLSGRGKVCWGCRNGLFSYANLNNKKTDKARSLHLAGHIKAHDDDRLSRRGGDSKSWCLNLFYWGFCMKLATLDYCREIQTKKGQLISSWHSPLSLLCEICKSLKLEKTFTKSLALWRGRSKKSGIVNAAVKHCCLPRVSFFCLSICCWGLWLLLPH